MDAREKMKQRLAAKKEIREFFSSKRKALGAGSIFDFSIENSVKRKLLGGMNSIGRDAEIKAMALVDRGDAWEPALDEAKQKLEKLKQDILKGLMQGDAAGKPYEKIAELIRSL